jgi:hypothetical protein
MKYYLHFILPMGRSRGFASTAVNERPLRTRFRLGYAAERLNRADDGKSPDHYAKGTPSLRLVPCEHEAWSSERL